MKGALVGSILFTGMALWTFISDGYELFTQDPIIIPIPHYGYFGIVWTDYVWWTTLGGMIELFFAFIFFLRSREKPIMETRR